VSITVGFSKHNGVHADDKTLQKIFNISMTTFSPFWHSYWLFGTEHL